MNKELHLIIIIVSIPILLFLFFSGLNIIENIADRGNNYKETYYEEADNFWACKGSMQEIERIEYDLFTYYNLTCEKINFILSSWDSEIITELDQVKLFGNTYKQVDYGVHKTLHLKKVHSVSNPTIDNCSVISSSYTDIYRKQDFLNIYLESC